MLVQLDVWSGLYRVVDEPRVQEVPADAVLADTRELARQALEIATAELGLDDLSIRWFDAESETSQRLRQKHGPLDLPWLTFEADEALAGITFGSDPSTLWIRSTLDPLDAAEATLHEARHARQYHDFLASKSGALNMTGASSCADQLAEIDARLWVREITEQLIDQAEHVATSAPPAARPSPTRHVCPPGGPRRTP